MDALLVGSLGAAAAVFGLLSWLLLAHPELVLGLLSDAPDDDHHLTSHPGTIRLVRWIAAGVVMLLGFLTGLIAVFLSGTG